MNTKTIRIDADDMAMALSHSDVMSAHHLDRETGEFIFTSDEDTGMTPEAWDALEEDPSRYLRIEPIPSSDSWDIMDDFIDTLEEGTAKIKLEDAIQMSKPFRRFKDRLHDYPDLREQWFRYEETALCEYAVEWLEENGVKAEFVSRYSKAMNEEKSEASTITNQVHPY